MNLLQVIASMNPEKGGTSQGIRNSNIELIKLGVHVEVVCLDDPGSVYLGSDLFLVTALGPSKTAWQFSEKLLPWLLENLPRFDVIIINGLWLYHGYAVRKALQRLGDKKDNNAGKVQRVFVMPHGMLDPYFQRAKSRRFKAVRNYFYWHLIERKLINSCNGILFTCETEMLLARKCFKLYRPKKELVIGYGTPEPPLYTTYMRDAFYAKCAGVKDEPYLLFLSRVHEKKGVETLINSYINVYRKMPRGAKFPKLVIVGPGLETVFGKKMQNLAYAQSNQIVFTGMLSGDAKWGAFYGCIAFILPSHQENFGIAVVEALACGKPVLISNQVNIWHEIKQEECGLVAPDTIDGTENLLTRWNDMPDEERLDMSLYARICFEKNFDIRRVSQKMFDAISNPSF